MGSNDHYIQRWIHSERDLIVEWEDADAVPVCVKALQRIMTNTTLNKMMNHNDGEMNVKIKFVCRGWLHSLLIAEE